MQKALTFFVVLLLAVSITACGGRRGVKTDAEGSIPIGSVDSGTIDSSTSGLDGGTIDGSSIGSGGVDDPLGKTTLYFDYDSAELTFESEEIARAHADNMLATPGSRVVLEGHADERGTREYNLALGERRAQSVARFMQAMGVTSDRIQSISYGEERPVVLDRTEEGWALNRRVEIIYSY